MVRTSLLLLVGLSGCSYFGDPPALNNVSPDYLVLSRSQQTNDQVRARAQATCGRAGHKALGGDAVELGTYQFVRFTCAPT